MKTALVEDLALEFLHDLLSERLEGLSRVANLCRGRPLPGRHVLSPRVHDSNDASLIVFGELTRRAEGEVLRPGNGAVSICPTRSIGTLDELRVLWIRRSGVGVNGVERETRVRRRHSPFGVDGDRLGGVGRDGDIDRLLVVRVSTLGALGYGSLGYGRRMGTSRSSS